MCSDRYAPARSRRLLRSVVVGTAVVSAAVVWSVLPGAAAAADELAGTTVVGELVQAWAESSPAEVAAGKEADGVLSWVDPTKGDPVPVDTEGVSGLPAGSTVAVSVARADGSGGTEDSPGTPRAVLASAIVAPATVPSSLPAPGPFTNQVTVAMVAPAGSPAVGDGTTLDSVVGVVDGPVADFWAEQSSGTISVGVTASHDWLAAPVDCSNPAVLWDAVAKSTGFVPGPGRHLLLYVSRQSDCSYALAEVGADPTSGGRLYVRDTTTSVIAHELGHNFGLGHSSGEQCDAAVEGGSCRTVGYRDYYDVMGVSWSELGSLNAPQAARLGVLPQTQLHALSVGGPATTMTLAPVSARTGARAVRLTDADAVDYWLEYRTATGRDEWLGTSANRYRLDSGVLLRRADGLPDTSVLLDGTPGPARGWDADLSAALPVGVAVPLSGGDFTVVVESLSSAGAVLSIAPGPGDAPVESRTADAPGGLMAAVPGAVSGAEVAATPAPPPEVPAPTTTPLPVDPAVAAPAAPAAPAVPARPALQSVVGTTQNLRDGDPVALAATGLAGSLLGGTVLLVVRRTRAVRLR